MRLPPQLALAPLLRPAMLPLLHLPRLVSVAEHSNTSSIAGREPWEWEESRASLDAFHISPNDGQRRELFYWIPADGCPAAPLLYFNRTHFCEVLRGKNIFFLGDSMTRTFHVGAVAMASDGRRINTTNFLNIFDHSICEDSPFGASHVPQLHTGHLKNGFSKSWRGVR